MEQKAKLSTLKLAESAIMIALATVLSLVKVFRLPLGGSITLLSMLPIAMISIKYGIRWGVCVSTFYGVIQLLLDAAESTAWGLNAGTLIACYLFDYVLAFGVLGLAGLFRKKGLKGQLIGVALVVLLRFLCHLITGVFIWGNWVDGWAVWSHSILYNGSYMLPEMVFTVIGSALLLKAPYVRKLCSPVYHQQGR